MTQIILQKCEDGAIWVTSDEDQIGSETSFKEIQDEDTQFFVALCDFLKYDPIRLLNFDYCVNKRMEEGI